MAKFTKYLSVCVILVSSRFIVATHLPEDDCDDDKVPGSDYFASGSAHSSHMLMPDGSVLTNSRGSSLSSDGIHRTFHELKKEADKYVSKSGSEADVHVIPGIPHGHFSPLFNENTLSSGKQSSFSSSQSGLGGSSQYVDEYQYSAVPTSESKVTSFKKHEMSKKVVSSIKGLSSGSNAAEEFDVEQNQGANSNANVNTFISPVVVPTIQSGYSRSHHHESESVQSSSSNVNPVLGTVQKTVVYHPVPLNAVYGSHAGHASESLAMSGSDINNPATYNSQKTVIVPSVPNTDTSSSSSHKFESYSHKQDANANIPPYLITRPHTFSTNVINLGKTDDEKLSHLIPRPEEHYTSESHSEQGARKETKEYAVPVVPKVLHTKNDGDVETVRPEELEGYGMKRVVVSQKVVEVPNDNRRTRFQISVQAPSETVGASQSYRKESHSQSIKTVSSDSGANSQAWVPSGVHEDDTAGHIEYSIRPVSSIASGSQMGEHVDETHKSGDTLQIPILVHGVPQNTGYFDTKTGSSSSHSSYSGGSHFSESSLGSHNLKFTGDATGLDRGSLFGSSDTYSIPAQSHVVPMAVSKSSSSSGYRYVFSNGHTGEQLVPNSNIYVSPEHSSFHQSKSTFQKLANAKMDSDAELVSSFGTPQKQTYGYSTAFSKHSSNINGKVSENREAAVAVNDNGKVDSYHVKSK